MEIEKIKEKIKDLELKYYSYGINKVVQGLYEDIKTAKTVEEIKNELENYCCDVDTMGYDIERLNSDLTKIFNLIEDNE